MDEPIHILNIGIRYEVREDDDYYAAIFEDFCAEHVSRTFSNFFFKP